MEDDLGQSLLHDMEDKKRHRSKEELAKVTTCLLGELGLLTHDDQSGELNTFETKD
jgi:hypothetical protein